MISYDGGSFFKEDNKNVNPRKIQAQKLTSRLANSRENDKI